MENLLKQHFDQIDLDIRKKPQGYSRFMDQKVTPDVLSFVAECILNLVDKRNKKFSVKDIWQSDYLEKNTMAVFGKPAPSNKTASAEYNKFIGQPLKTLSYSKILIEYPGNPNLYQINNRQILEYIALNQRNAFLFLNIYLQKVLYESGFGPDLKRYINLGECGDLSNTDFSHLKKKFTKFIFGNTNITKTLEVRRIFPKILNIFAVAHGINGTRRGFMTKFPFVFSDLEYNRKNFRDLKKAKGLSRQEALTKKIGSKVDYEKYRIAKATNLIKNKYKDSEVKDRWAIGQATHVHHIFSQSLFPEFADYTENLIKLTPEQHFSLAHPNAKTQEVNSDYQKECLIAKSFSIEASLQIGEFIYSKGNFIYMVNKCLGTNLQQEMSFNNIRKEIRNISLID